MSQEKPITLRQQHNKKRRRRDTNSQTDNETAESRFQECFHLCSRHGEVGQQQFAIRPITVHICQRLRHRRLGKRQGWSDRHLQAGKRKLAGQLQGLHRGRHRNQHAFMGTLQP